MDEKMIEAGISTREAVEKYREQLENGEYVLEFTDDSRGFANVVRNERESEDITQENSVEIIEEGITDYEANNKYKNELESGEYKLEYVQGGANGLYDDGPVTIVNVIKGSKELTTEEIERINELNSRIAEWEKELREIWGYTARDTDGAEVERRNLNNLIQNAKREINIIKGINLDDPNLPDPNEYLQSLKEEDRKNKDLINELNKQIKPIDLRIEKLKEEQKMYENDKNGEKVSYKEIYEDYSKKIEEAEKEKKEILEKIEQLKNKSLTSDDKFTSLPILTKGRKNVEKEIRDIRRQIKKTQIKIAEIMDSPNIPMEEKTLSDGTIVKISVLEKYNKKLDKLNKTLKEKEDLLEDFKHYYDLIDGNHQEQSFKYSEEQNSDFMRFFHGQGHDHEGVQRDENGNIVGNVDRDDRRINDEYFGFEKRKIDDKKDKKGPDDPGLDDPGPDDPGPDNPGPDDPGQDDPGQDDPGPDDPGQDDPGQDDPGQDDPGPDDPGQDDPKNALIRSGLQIFRDEFNKMPEIKRRHTSSERMPFFQTALGIGGIVATAFTGVGLLGLIPVAIAPTLGPISRFVTGQNKIEKQIADQFRDLERNNPNEFDRMVDYLSEEKIQDVKPNAVILRALHKVQMERTAKQLKILQNEVDGLELQRNRILKKASIDPDSLTEKEKSDIEYTTRRLIEINEGTYGLDSRGHEFKIESEVERLQRRFKDLKRGKDRVSQRYKGNLATGFNIFAHRNSDTKHYKGPLNELADAELARDMMIMRGDYLNAGQNDKNMQDILNDNTYTNICGVQNSVFNNRTGSARIMSDKHDNTYSNLFTAASLVGVTAAAHHAASIAKQGQQVDLTGSKDVAQKAADGVRGDTYMQGEVAAIRGNGTTTAPGYHNADKLANQWGDNAQTTITSNKLADQLKQIANTIRGNNKAAQAVQDASNKQLGFVKNGFKYDVNHTPQLENLSNYVANNNAKADMLDNAAKTIEALEANSSQMATNMNNIAKKAFMGPIFAGLGALQRIGSGIVKNIREARDNSKAGGER